MVVKELERGHKGEARRIRAELNREKTADTESRKVKGAGAGVGAGERRAVMV